MQAATQGDAIPRRADDPITANATADKILTDALMAMGLETLDASQISSEFREPIIRLAASWQAAISKSTLITRRCDLRRFARWSCKQQDAPFASDASLASLMDRHLVAVGKSFAPGTAKRVGSNLSALARGVGSDAAAVTAQDRCKQAARAAQKRARDRGFVLQKEHLTVSQMQALRSSIQASDALPLRRLRDLALFDIMCDLLARRSEIVGMRLRDIDLAAGTVRISYSKTDQAGRGAVFNISPRTVASLSAWLNASGLLDVTSPDTGALPAFVAVMNDGSIRRGSDGLPSPMNGKSVARILQRYAEPLGISGVAGHSIRRSMARALHEAGVPEEEITKKGRWSSLSQMREYVGLCAPIDGATNLVFK